MFLLLPALLLPLLSFSAIVAFIIYKKRASIQRPSEEANQLSKSSDKTLSKSMQMLNDIQIGHKLGAGKQSKEKPNERICFSL
jgi:hypothetical protein